MRPTTFTPESPNDPSHTTILQASDEQKNSAQIKALLDIQEEARQLLCGDVETGTEFEVDDDAAEDARSTYTAAGLQLRNIIDQQERWTIHQNAVDAKTEQVMDLKIHEHKQRMKLNEKQLSPSTLYRPQVRKIVVPPGRLVWVCWLGGNEPLAHDIHGMGASPAEAMEEFDKAFNIRVVQQHAQPATEAAPSTAKRQLRKKK